MTTCTEALDFENAALRGMGQIMRYGAVENLEESTQMP
jgi:hypothetical protein